MRTSYTNHPKISKKPDQSSATRSAGMPSWDKLSAPLSMNFADPFLENYNSTVQYKSSLPISNVNLSPEDVELNLQQQDLSGFFNSVLHSRMIDAVTFAVNHYTRMKTESPWIQL